MYLHKMAGICTFVRLHCTYVVTEDEEACDFLTLWHHRLWWLEAGQQEENFTLPPISLENIL